MNLLVDPLLQTHFAYCFDVARPRAEDLIVEVDGTPVEQVNDLQRLMAGELIGRSATMQVVRGGKPTDSRVFLAGAEVPQLYHFGGFTSVFPTQLVDHVDFCGCQRPRLSVQIPAACLRQGDGVTVAC